MAALMGTVLLTILVVGTAALSGHPLFFIAAAVLLAGAVYVLTGRTRHLRTAGDSQPRRKP